MSRTLGEILRVAIGGGLALLLGRVFLLMGLALPCRAASESMEPTLQAGGRILIDRTAFWFRAPQRWQVIVFRCPDSPRELCVKRIAGLPGERVRIHRGQVYVHKKPQPPPIVVRYGPRRGQELGDSPEYTLGPGDYFVLGDNSIVSEDSRTWEPAGIREESILGRVLMRGQESGAARQEFNGHESTF